MSAYMQCLSCTDMYPAIEVTRMKILKVALLSVVLLGSAMVVYGWTTDCEDTAGIYVSCKHH